jgi:ribosomal protein S18 acetylase RimI-like enzyme
VTARHRERPPWDAELYGRGAETLLASWAEYARNAGGAALRRLPGVAAAVFADEPERNVYNNALLDRRLPSSARVEAVEAMEAVYAAAGITRFAAWVHERDTAMRAELERRRYSVDTSTRAMGMRLHRLALPRPELVLVELGWDDYLRTFGLPSGLLTGGGRAGLRVHTACLAGEPVATAMAYDLDGDCGIYNVATLPHARRRGLGTALTTVLLHDARARGCRTASLQSTPMAERVYAAAGFSDLGRFIEYVPAVSGR